MGTPTETKKSIDTKADKVFQNNFFSNIYTELKFNNYREAK